MLIGREKKRGYLFLVCVIFIAFLNSYSQTGSILREYWSGISGTTVSALTSNPNFPNNPTSVSLLTGYLEASANWNDNYGTRIRGYIHPPITGNYVFWIASDDNSELWLSSDDKQSRKSLIAYVNGYTSSRQWTKYPSQQSAAIYLVAGRRYYIEVLHKEGTANDNCAVGWQLPDGTYERPIPTTRLSPVTDDDDYSLWRDTTRILINTKASGANISENVYSFPVLVRLNYLNFDFSKAKPDGSDIRFAKSDGTHLPYYVELWDTLSKKADIWVKLDTIYGNDSTRYFTMLWGNNSAVSRSNSKAVFDTTISKFMGVWHLNQNPAGTPPQMTDGSLKNNHGTTQGGMTISNSTEGIIGRAIILDGIDDYISTTTQFTAPQVFTASLWFKTISSNGGMIFGFGNNPVGASNSKDRQIWLDSLGRINFGVWYNGAQYHITANGSWNDGNWHQITAQFSSSGLKLYVDGSLRASNSSITSAISYSGYWRIGYDNMLGWYNLPKSFFTQGTLDNIVVSHTNLSEGWIKLWYQNQRVGSSFLRIQGGDDKPFVYLTSHISAVPETSITVMPFSVTASLPYPALVNKSITVNLNYSGNATMGSDYQNMPTTISVTIPKDSLEKKVLIPFTPVNDIINEGNEFVVLKIVADTTFYRCNPNDSIVLEIVDNDQQYKPTITLEPSDLHLLEGDEGRFIVEVTGTPPFTYKWFKNGLQIQKAPNSAIYTIPQVTYADSGSRYYCIVTNSVGSDTSRQAIVHVSRRPVPPRIVVEPLSQTVAEGDSAIFKVVVSGTPPFSFKWFCDTAAISGANDSILIIRKVKFSDDGKRYYCQVTNSVGGVLSKVVQLSVRKPSSQSVVITGDLYNSGYKPIGDVEETKMNFKVQLYSTEKGGTPLYTETFYEEDNKAIVVKNGKFVLVLGEGKTSDDLLEVVRSNRELYISFTISTPGGNPETLDRRIPLTASPYSLSALPQIIKGKVNPQNAGIEAPIGTHFINTENDSTYIRTAKGWVILR